MVFLSLTVSCRSFPLLRTFFLTPCDFFHHGHDRSLLTMSRVVSESVPSVSSSTSFFPHVCIFYNNDCNLDHVGCDHFLFFLKCLTVFISVTRFILSIGQEHLKTPIKPIPLVGDLQTYLQKTDSTRLGFSCLSKFISFNEVEISLWDRKWI